MALHRLKHKNNASYFKHLLLLSGDINLNPGPPPEQPQQNDMWLPFTKRGLHFVHININSLLPKIDEIRSFAQQTNVSVIGITETKLDNSVLDAEIKIDGYDLMRWDRNRHGGGIACYVKNGIQFNRKDDIFSDGIENIFFDIIFPNSQSITVGLVYRPPNQHSFLDDFQKEFYKLNTTKHEVYILGDFNINLNSTKHQPIHPLLNKYIEFLSNFGLKQLIKSPTRITCSSSSIIDHILTNACDKISDSGVIDIGISDHQMIYCTRKVVRIKSGTNKYVNFRSLKNYSPTLFEDALSALDFPNYENYDDIEIAYSDFVQKVTNVIDDIAPKKHSKIKNTTQEWFDKEIADKIAIREKHFKTFKRTRLQIHQNIFKASQNEVKKLIKQKKKLFFQCKLKENIGKPKELWKTLKGLGLPSKNTSSSEICLKEDGKNIFNAKSTSNMFKDFFSNLATNLVSKLPNPPNKFGEIYFSSFYKTLKLEEELTFTPVSRDSILKILNNLDTTKAVGVDNLNSKFLKDGAKILASPIAQICNLSISSSSFPNSCKTAKIKPLYKKGCKTDPQNYRPISILPVLSKIIERVIHEQTQSFLTRNNILFKFQSGFRPSHSTDTCLSFLNDKILKGFDSGLLTGMILIDLQKAFDTIDHEILFTKMKYLGFSNHSINWFKSYFANRTFKVNVNDVFSNPGYLTCGVPQGSILGPLLFLLYINDMPQAVSCDLFLYADDSCLVYQDKDIKVIERRLNTDFSNLCDWFVDNKLSIHFGQDKTKSILFSSKNKIKNLEPLNISYQNINIKQHSKVKYLGCIFDATLSGESMARHVTNKINSKLRFLYRNNRILSQNLKRLLCNALIQPHFDYACLAWYPNLNKALKKRLQTAQNKCIRYCLQLGNRSHIGQDELLRINWLNVNDRVDQCASVQAFKFFNSTIPLYMNDVFSPAESSNINTRNSFQRLKQPFRKTNVGQNCLSYMGPSVWNKLPRKVKNTKNLNTFKHNVKAHFLGTDQ